MHSNPKYIIVGQGLAGTLLSFQLYQSGISHIVVASHKQGTASMVAAGMYNPLVFKRITKSWLVDELLPVMEESFRALEELLSCQLLYKKPIVKLISPDEKTWWNQRIENQNIQEYVKRFLPPGVIKGVDVNFEAVVLNRCGYVDLASLITAYRKFLKKQNMLLESDFDYEDLIFDGEKITWKEYTSTKVIFCEGAAGVKNPYFDKVKFCLTKGDVLEVEIEGLSNDYIINKDIFLMPVGNNRFKLGSTYNHSNKSWEPDPEAADFLIKKASKITDKPVTAVGHHSGIRPTVSDRRPVLGIHPQFKQLAFFNGLGTKGVMLAPFFSREMKRLVEGVDFELNREVKLERFYK